jgi:hypothetical protein
VPDTRTHRGPDPHDAEAFGPAALPALQQAVADLSWLLGRGYSAVSAVKLVGDRWSLIERQRLALRRAACSDEARIGRLARRMERSHLRDSRLAIDGFNVVTTVEAALGGGVVLHCRDETFRDLAGVHGTYRKVAETMPGLRFIGETVLSLGVAEVRWLFDRPVSNSGRVRGILVEMAQQEGANWTVELVDDPDPVLKATSDIVASADSAILDRCGSWFNLARVVVEDHSPEAKVVNLKI